MNLIDPDKWTTVTGDWTSSATTGQLTGYWSLSAAHTIQGFLAIDDSILSQTNGSSISSTNEVIVGDFTISYYSSSNTGNEHLTLADMADYYSPSDAEVILAGGSNYNDHVYYAAEAKVGTSNFSILNGNIYYPTGQAPEYDTPLYSVSSENNIYDPKPIFTSDDYALRTITKAGDTYSYYLDGHLIWKADNPPWADNLTPGIGVYGNATYESAAFWGRALDGKDIAIMAAQGKQHEFTLVDAALFASASYALGTDDQENYELGNASNPGAYTNYERLFGAGTNFTPFDINNTNERGVFTNDNAGALVGRLDDTLVLTFTGTNDRLFSAKNFDNWLVMGVAAGAGIATGGFAGAAITIELVKIMDRILDAGGMDQAHWLNRAAHWELFEPLVSEIGQLLENDSEINSIKIIGHSLGAAMVPYMVSQIDKWETQDRFSNKLLDVDGITFASPGYSPIDGFVKIDANDPRITNFWNSSDIINLPAWFSKDPGDDNTWFVEMSGSWVDNFKEHSMLAYLAESELLETIGLGIGEFMAAGNSLLGSSLDAAKMFFEYAGKNEYIVDSGSVEYSASHLYLGQFFEDILSPAVIVGSDGSDILRDPDGDGNIFAGLEGDDTITGGNLGADVFVFREGDGNDTIIDFDSAMDLIDARDFGSGADYFANVTPEGELLIDFGEAGSIHLAGYLLSDFSSISVVTSEFDFIA